MRSGAYTLLEKILLQLLRFGSFYLLVRALSKESFGIWTLFLIICALAEVSRMGLIQNALIKFLAGTEERKIQARINTASVSLHFILTIIQALLLAGIARMITLFLGLSPLEDLLHYYIVSSIFLLPFHQFNFIQQANLQFKGIFYSNVAREGAFFLFVLLGFLTDLYPLKLTYLAFVQIGTAAIGAVVAWYFGREYLTFSYNLDRWWFRWLYHYGKYVIGTNLASMFIKSIDQMMIGVMLNPVALALYGTAIRIGNLVEVPTQSLAAIVYPQSTRRLETDGLPALKILYEKSVGVLLAIIVPMVLVVLIVPEEILWFIAGDQYLDAAPVLRVTMLFGLFIPFSRQFGTMMDAMGHPRLNFRLVILSAVLNVGFNALFISWWGLMGAAYATLLTFGIIFIANQVILYQKLQVKPLRAFWYAGKVYLTGILLIRQRLAKATH